MNLFNLLKSLFYSGKESNATDYQKQTMPIELSLANVKGYMLVIADQPHQPVRLADYFNGNYDKAYKSDYTFFKGRGLTTKIYLSLDDLLAQRTVESPSGLTSNSRFILRIGYDLKVATQMMQHEMFHFVIQDALDYYDVLKLGIKHVIPIVNPNFKTDLTNLMLESNIPNFTQ